MEKQLVDKKIDFRPFLSFVLGIGIGILVFFFLLYTDWLQPDYASNERLTESVFDSTGDVTDDELDSLFQDLFRELDQPKTHGAPGIDPARYNDKLDRLCRIYDDYCTLLRLPNGLSDQELFFYKALSVFSLARIDRFLTTPQKLVDILNRFSLTNNGGRRGYAVADGLTINLGSIGDFREYIEILIHELGHPIDLGVIVGSSQELHPHFTEFGTQKFSVDDPSLEYYKLSWQSEKIRKPEANKFDFCSSYGQSNTFEDFAECVNLRKSHNALFRYFASRSNVMKKKYNYMAQLFDGKYFFDSENDLLLIKANPDAVFFDTTKISLQ